MSIEQAILRKIRLGESFCSYSFKPIKKMNGGFVIQAQRSHKYLSQNSKLSSARTTATTIQIDSSRIRSSRHVAKKSVYGHNKQNNHKLSTFIRPISAVSIKKSKKHIKQQKINKMDEYLSDYTRLKSQYEFKTNKFQNIPKQLNNYCQRQNQSLSTGIQNNSFTATSKFDYFKYRDIEVKNNFNPTYYPQFFYDFSIDQNNIEFPFTTFTMISLANNKYVEGSVSERMFSQIPMKEYQQRLNNFSTKIEQSIFYLALGKDKIQDQYLPYTQCFFWIAKPIKHMQRFLVLKYIKKFLLFCIKNLTQETDRTIGPKIWIVDFNGKISYINRQQIISYMQQTIHEQHLHNNASSCREIGEVCLSMFISSINRGMFCSDSNTPQTTQKYVDLIQRK